MSGWVLKAVNALLLLAILAAIPFAIRAYEPIEKNNKAVEALQHKQYDRAIELLSEAVEQSPKNDVFRRNLLAAYNSKAIELERDGNDDQALNWYEKALTIDPQNQTLLRNYISTLNNLAVAQSKTKNFPDSQSLFERASKSLKKVDDPLVRRDIQGNYSSLLTLWGAELMKRDQFDGAQVAFEQAIELNTKNAVANIYLGDLFYERNAYDKAKKYYTAAVPLDKENREYLTNRLEMIQEESKVEPHFKTAKDDTGRFVLQYIEYKNGVPIETLTRMLNEAYEAIGEKLGIYPARSVNVKIYNAEEFRLISKLPEWAIGIFDGKMRLELEHVQSAPSQVRDLLYHEYTHAVLAMNVKQRVPAWFHEGLAQLMEPQFAENLREQAQMRDAIIKNKLNFSNLEDSFKEFENKRDAETAYLLSKYFLANLNRRFGQPKLVEWIKLLAAEKPFDEAFADVYGFPLEKAKADWISQVTKAE